MKAVAAGALAGTAFRRREVEKNDILELDRIGRKTFEFTSTYQLDIVKLHFITM
jgi:hypothetical protein